MYAYFFAKPLQGEMFWQLRAMIQGIPENTLNVDMSCPRDIAKVAQQDYIGQNGRQTRGTATARTDSRGGACMDTCGSPCTDT